MTHEGAAFRGQPLLLLGALLLGWAALRVALWEPPTEGAFEVDRLAQAVPGLPLATSQDPVQSPPHARAGNEPSAQGPPAIPLDRIIPAVPAPLEPPSVSPLGEGAGPAALPSGEQPPEPRASARVVVGHNLLLVSSLEQTDLPPALAALMDASEQPVPGIPAAPPMLIAVPPPAMAATSSRWSGDAWLLLRRDTTTPLLSGRPSYGRSQAGAILRYHLAPTSSLRPQAYVRASHALAGAREKELAAGISARPIGAVPLRVAAEARVRETERGTRLVPAGYAVTELPPLALPFRLRAEAYAQAGYVGGDEATAFVDGQARIERPLIRRGELELTAGAGAWGGAQKGAARLDVGPSAVLSFRLGDLRGRVAADYRFRVAGRAEPASGPTLTVSAGF